MAVTVALMPASCASALIVRQYGGSSDFAGQAIMFIDRLSRDFPGGPVVKIPCFCRGLRFNPCSGN